MSDKPRVPAVEGWFTDGEQPHLLARRGVTSGSFFYPRHLASSRNPAAPDEELEEVTLGRRGRVWSWTTNHYQPPPPYVTPEPFVPYTVVAVELADEQMVVLGQLAEHDDPAELAVGREVELTIGTLYEDDDTEYSVWKWRLA